MNLSKLNNSDAEIVRDYVRRKFKAFKGLRYLRKTRIKKVDAYYIAAGAGPHGRPIIKSVYEEVFGELFDEDEPLERARAAQAKKPEVVLIESQAWLEKQDDYREEVEKAIADLKRWQEKQDWQLGEGFFARLVERVSFVDDKICDQTQFRTEFSSQCKAAITAEKAVTREEMSAAFDLMVGFEQKAACTFEARGTNWGLINAKLEESFKAGVWASGSAKAAMQKLGFTTEMQAALAVGALLNIEGELSWTKGKGGLKLGGSAEVFGGARGEVSAKLSASALKGLEASVSAGAFAGLSFKAEGSCSFVYGEATLASVTGSASIDFGVGATFEASIKAPIFGPTSISLESGVTMGIGSTVSVEMEIDFDEVALASSRAFKQVVYWRTMARGYEMGLMDSDAKNLYYLKKAIARLEEELESTEGVIDGYNKTPIEKRRLLMAI